MKSKNVSLARSPLHAWQAAHGARFVDQHGWTFPQAYCEASREVAAAGAGLALADVSPFGKYSFRGKDWPDRVRALLEDPQPGRVALLQGRHPGWLCYLAEDHLLFLSTSMDDSENGVPADLVPGMSADQIWDLTSSMAGFVLFGPGAAAVLGGRLDLGTGPAALLPGSCVETGLYGVPALLVRPPTNPSSVGIWVPWDLAEYVWERLGQIGAPRQLVHLGMEGLKTLGWNG